MTTLQIFDVEYGACALLTCSDNTRLMIDCGYHTSMPWCPSDHLHGLGVQHLDALIITSTATDYLAELLSLGDRISIGAVISNTIGPARRDARVEMLDCVDTAMAQYLNKLQAPLPLPQTVRPSFPDVEWRTYWHDEGLVLHLKVHGMHFLFPGNLERDGWIELLESSSEFRAAASNTDVLVASSHGRDNGICPDLFEVYQCYPRIVVISDDHHHYDTAEAMRYYSSKSEGILTFRNQGHRRVLSTRRDGDLIFTLNEFGCHVD